MMLPPEKLILDAYKAAERDIPDSDLDDEQPISLLVRMTLGELREIRRAVAARDRGATGVAADLKAREEYDAGI